jgi:hypothetical protein
MSFSLNEVESMAKKGTRGAGYDWGPAEEAGRATRWLCARGVDGCAALAALLTRVDGVPGARAAPVIGDTWAAQGGVLCPVAAGMALSDRASALAGTVIRLENVVQPMLVLPFVAHIARAASGPVRVTCEGPVAATDGPDLCLTGGLPGAAALVIIEPGEMPTAPNPCTPRAHPAPETWETLARFAQRTYAPATEASRLRGAGAGLSDND